VCDGEQKHQHKDLQTVDHSVAWLSAVKYWLIDQVSSQRGHFNVSFPYI